jgi:hypothetical protein
MRYSLRLVWPAQARGEGLQAPYETRPIKARAWVLFAPGGDVLVTRKALNTWKGFQQLRTQLHQRVVLRLFKVRAFQPLQLYAYREVVAVVRAMPVGLTRVPGPVPDRHELRDTASSGDHEVAGDGRTANGLKVGVCVPIEGVGEQPLYAAVAKLARGQADGVQHHQTQRNPLRSRPMVRRGAAVCTAQPAVIPALVAAVVHTVLPVCTCGWVRV